MRKLRLLGGYLRFQSFDVSAPEGRAAERYRLAAWAAVSNVISRGFSVVLAVLGIHLTTAYLGGSRFGVWATFASMTALLSFLDLGVGNALVNRVAQAAAQGDEQALRRTVTGGVAFLGVIAVGIGGLMSLVFVALPWGRIFRLTDDAVAAEAAIFVVDIVFLPVSKTDSIIATRPVSPLAARQTFKPKSANSKTRALTMG